MKIIFRVKSVTPIFIGSGEDSIALNKNHIGEFLITGENKVYFIDLDKLARYFINNPQKITNQFNVEQLIRKIGPENLSKYYLPLLRPQNNPKNPRDRYSNPTKIKLFIKDANGKPYIPGSSLKGSLRTAILWKASYETKDLKNVINKIHKVNRKKPGDDKELIRVFLRGKEDDPKYDIMKAVIVRDMKILSSKRFVTPYKVYNILKNKKLKFRIWLEMIFINKAYFEIIIDENLLNKTELSLPANAKKAILNLKSTIKEYSKFLLEKYNGIGNANNLLNLIKSSILFYVGWGGGWNAMTGSLLSESDKGRLFRNRHFPVSRRLVYYDGQWVLPGWLQLQ